MSKISELSDGGSLLPTDFLIAVRSGGNVKVQADQTEFDRIRLGDGEKIELGNNQDLQIYHDGANSYISDAGTGLFQLRTNGSRIEMVGQSGSEYMARFEQDGAVKLYYDNSLKLATTATGIDVTGSVTADGGTGTATSGGTLIVRQKGDTNADGIALTSSHAVSHRVWKDAGGNLNIGSSSYPSAFVQDFTGNVDIAGTATMDGLTVQTSQGDISIPTNTSSFNFERAGSNYIRATDASGSFNFITGADNFSTQRLKIANNGDISFFEDTGTTAKLFWDASAESLGIGTANVLGQLHINAETAVPTKVYVDGETNQPKSIEIRHYDTSEQSGAGRNLFYLKTPASGRLDIGNFSDGTSETQLMTFLESGSVGIGTSSPIAPLHVKGTTNGNLLVRAGSLAVGTLTGTALSSVNDAVSATTPLTLEGSEFNFVQSNAVKVKVDSSGNVGIGVTPEAWNTYKALQIGNGAIVNYSPTHDMRMVSNAYYDSGWKYAESDGACNYLQDANNSAHRWEVAASGTADAAITWSQAMTLDASGNLLVGKTSADSTTVGTQIEAAGAVAVTRDGSTPLYLNRKTSDGTIADFRKDGTTVGSIGYGAGVLGIGQGTGNLGLFNATVIPMGSTSGAASDGVITLGSGARRFKDLYLSGGAYLGGTAAANKLDSYEEGTWTPVIKDTSATGTTVAISSVACTYTKIGRIVTLVGSFTRNDTATLTGNLVITGLPFTATGGQQMGGNAWVDNTSGDLLCQITAGNTSTMFLKSVDAPDVSVTTDSWHNNRPIYFTRTYQVA